MSKHAIACLQHLQWSLENFRAAVTHKSNYRAGISFCIVGLAISLATWSWSHVMNDVPLSTPVTLSPGHFQSREFKTRVNTQYRINIALDSGIPFEELDCLIGANIKSVQPCTGQPPVLNVKWQVLSAGKPVESGSSAELGGASYSYHKVAATYWLV